MKQTLIAVSILQKDNKRGKAIMNIFEQLSKNKGTVSSSLSEDLARQILEDNQIELLAECVDLVTYQASEPGGKQIRAGAAKVVELVAEKQPERVAPYLKKLLPALGVAEPQTRWMIIRTMGYGAPLNKALARQAIPYAEAYIDAKEGLCLASSTDLFLGDVGSLSKPDAHKIFPLLEQSMDTAIANEQDWLLEAFLKIFPNLDAAEQTIVLGFARRWQSSARKSTQQRARKILSLN
jgi:hypothetical protein